MGKSYKPPYIEWYESDFHSQRVRQLPPIARLMYRSLLQQSTQHDPPGYLPSTDVERSFYADAPDAQTWDEHRDKILALFEKNAEGMLYHPRVLAGLERALKKVEASAKAGLASAAARKKKGGNARSTSAQRPFNDRSTNQNQNQNQNQQRSALTPVEHPLNIRSTPVENSDRKIELILGAHPKAEFGPRLQNWVIEAAEEEMQRNGFSMGEALEFIYGRTTLYRQCVDGWLDKTKAMGPEKFFANRGYRQDDSMWRQPEQGKGPSEYVPLKPKGVIASITGGRTQ